MGYGLKYHIAYNRRSGNLTTIEILENNNYGGPIHDLTPDGVPLDIQWTGDITNIYKPTNGSGATLQVLATPLTMMDLMTSDPQKFMVIVYDGIHGSNVRWQGFVSTDLYSENYSYATTIKIPIIIQCTDGMSIFENIKYLQSDGSFYTGMNTLMTVFGNCVMKLALNSNNLYTNNATLVDGIENELLNGMQIFQENFINESDEPMSCREVLDSIIGGLNMTMFFLGEDIYLLDPINLHDPSMGWSYSNGAYSIGGYKDISLKELKWGETDSQLDIVPAINEAYVKYDPYNFYYSLFDFNEADNISVTATYSDMTGWFESTDIRYVGWTADPYQYISIKETVEDTGENVLFLNSGGSIAIYTFPRSVVINDSSMAIKISMDVYVQTKENNANIYSANPAKTVWHCRIPVGVMVGDKYFQQDNQSWEVTPYYRVLTARQEGVSSTDYQNSNIGNKWTASSMIVDLTHYIGENLVSGEITVCILDNLLTGIAGMTNIQIEPNTEPYFGVTTGVNSYDLGDLSDAQPVTQYAIQVEITGFKALAGIDAGEHLYDSAVTAIVSTSPGGSNVVSGEYHDYTNALHVFSSTQAQTTFSPYTYVSNTDTLVFNIVTSGSAYFTGTFDHFVSINLNNLVFTYNGTSTIVMVKNVSCEIVSASRGKNIGNPGVEVHGILSTNLTGKSPFVLNTTTGAGTFGASKGSLKSVSTGLNITGLERVGEGHVYDTAKLILQNIVHQYQGTRYKISGVFDTIGQPINLRTFLIKDSSWLGAKAFYMVQGTYHDQDELLSVEMIEIADDTREAIDDLDNPGA